MPEKIPFSDLVEINPPISISFPEPGSDVSFIPMQDVSDSGAWDYRQTRQISSIKNGYTSFQEGDVLFAKITPCMENGKGTHAIGLANGIGFGSTEFHVLRAKNHAFSRFVFHWCNFKTFREAAEVHMTGSAGQKRVPADFFSKFLVPKIDKDEQQAIAKIIDVVDQAIRQAEVLIAKLRQIKAGMLHDLLTRGLDENGELRDPVRHPDQFKDSKVGLIPKEWACVNLNQVADIASGLTLGQNPEGSGSLEIPYLRVANVQDGYLDLTDVKRIRVNESEVDRFSLCKGDVLMNEGGDFDKLGRGAVWEGQIEPCLHQNHVFRVRPRKSMLNSYFLNAVSSSHIGKRFFLLSSKQSTNLASINSSQLKSFPVPCPPLIEQEAIVSVLSRYDRRVGEEEKSLAKWMNIKQGLMNDLLTGKVRVPEKLLEAMT